MLPSMSFFVGSDQCEGKRGDTGTGDDPVQSGCYWGYPCPTALIPCSQAPVPGPSLPVGELFQARGRDLLGCIRGLVCLMVDSREARVFGVCGMVREIVLSECFPISHLFSGRWGRGLVVAPGLGGGGGIHLGLHFLVGPASYLAMTAWSCAKVE